MSEDLKAPRYRLVGYDIGTAPDENGGWVHWTDHEAEIARLTAERDAALAGAVKVKPLVWFEVEKSRYGGKYTADGYTIRYIEGLWLLDFAGQSKAIWRFPTIEAAKAAAQTDYDARILAAIQPDPDARQADLSDAARDVLAERARQISAEGWTPEHDDQHVDGEMAQASGCYALNAAGWKTEALRGCWPIKWMAAWFKPTTPRRDLVKAGALIIAEIERLDRATPPADLAAKIGGE